MTSQIIEPAKDRPDIMPGDLIAFRNGSYYLVLDIPHWYPYWYPSGCWRLKLYDLDDKIVLPGIWETANDWTVIRL